MQKRYRARCCNSGFKTFSLAVMAFTSSCVFRSILHTFFFFFKGAETIPFLFPGKVQACIPKGLEVQFCCCWCYRQGGSLADCPGAMQGPRTSRHGEQGRQKDGAARLRAIWQLLPTSLRLEYRASWHCFMSDCNLPVSQIYVVLDHWESITLTFCVRW